MKLFGIKNVFKRWVPIILLLFFSYWAVRPILGRGYFPMHDDTQVARVIEMGKALRSGQFPVRWVGDLGYGYGYPLYNFYGPLPYYFGGFLYWGGVDALIATKAMFILGILMSCLTMYILVNSLFGSAAGFVSGILYLYAPYHAVDIYVRGAVGEFWAIAFLPLVVYGLVKTREKQYNWLIGAVGISGVILSHTILGYVTVFFVSFGSLSYFLIQWIRKKIIVAIMKKQIYMVLLGLGFSAFFWLPAIGEMGATNVAAQIGGTADFRNHFVCISQLWNSPWGFGGSAPGCLDGMSFQLGKFFLIISFISILAQLLTKKVNQYARVTVLWGLLIVVVSVFFMSDISSRLWEIIPEFSFVQYPWRFLSYAILGLSLVSGSLVLRIHNVSFRWVIALGLSIATVFFYTKLFIPQYLYEPSTSTFESASDLRWRVSKISDEYLPPDFKKPDRFEDTPSGPFAIEPSVTVDTEINTETYVKAFVQASANTQLGVNRTAFLGWHYLVDGKDVPATMKNALPYLSLLPGTHVVEIVFSDTQIRYFGNLLTIFSVFAVLYSMNRKT